MKPWEEDESVFPEGYGASTIPRCPYHVRTPNHIVLDAGINDRLRPCGNFEMRDGTILTFPVFVVSEVRAAGVVDLRTPR
jgi:hypothetical protein